MPRVDDYLNLVDDPKRHGFTPGHPADDALIALLAHMAFSDGEVHERELDFLQRVLPGRHGADLRMWAMAAGARPLDLDAVAAAVVGLRNLIAAVPTRRFHNNGIRSSRRLRHNVASSIREDMLP